MVLAGMGAGWETVLAAGGTAAPAGGVGFGALFALVLFILASMWIGWLANKATREGSFMEGFFLGNRGLGAWALALTATVQSGGTFMGFPSLVYSYGWSVALWIAGYMVVPITGFGFLGKRLAHLSRRTRAITLPDMFRTRFHSPQLGLLASLFIMFYMTFMMVAQFKAGALVMKLAWPTTGSLALSEETNFEISAASLANLKQKLSPAVLSQVAPLQGKSFATETAFTAALKTQLSAEEVLAYKPAILNEITPLDKMYLIGLAIFTVTVVGYTLLGGFLAAVWTDLFQSVMMFVGVLLLLGLVLWQVWHTENIGSLEAATRVAAAHTSSDYAFCPGFDPKGEGRAFMPIGLAVSFFFLWVFAGAGSPAGSVRLMASDSSATIRRSIYLLSLYNACIYIPLIVICICGRALVPSLVKTDEIIPLMSLSVTSQIPYIGSFLGGLILAAPFGAVMATVSSYLVVISSGLVRDVYQRLINPHASQHRLRAVSYLAMIGVGAIAVAANIWPVDKLQAIVVFSGSGAGATFCVPLFMMCYWRRTTAAGVMASMLTGTAVMTGLYAVGFLSLDHKLNSLLGLASPLIGQASAFRPWYLLGLDPVLWGLSSSLLMGIGVSLATTPPSPELVSHLFDAQPGSILTSTGGGTDSPPVPA